MGTDWDNMLAADATSICGDSASPSEPVVLTIGDGRQFAFNAVINRVAPTAVSQAAMGKAGPMFADSTTAFLPFDAAGISGTPVVPVRNNTLGFPSNVGDDSTEHLIVAVLTQDAGGFLVQIR